MKHKIRISVLVVCLSFWGAVYGQSLRGMEGLITVPTASIYPDGTIFIAGTYQNRVNFREFEGNGWLADNFYTVDFNITFLKFLELGFRNNIRKLPDETEKGYHYQIDRGISLKLQLIKEKKYLPSVALGCYDAFGTGYDRGLFGVVSKRWNIAKHEIGITGGYIYAPDRANIVYNLPMHGVMAGVNYRPGFFRQLSLMAEYDSNFVNIGLNVLLFNHLYVIAGMQQCKHFSGGIGWQYQLKL